MLKMQYGIREPVEDDIKEIEKLFELTISDNFREEGIVDYQNTSANKEIGALKEELRRYFESRGGLDKYLVACFKGQIIGTIASGEPNELICENLNVDYSNTPEVKSVYILPRYQNRGVGTFLLRNILMDLNNSKVDCFCLDSGYKRAQHYWNKRIGEPKCVLKDYWNKEAHHMIWFCQVAGTLEFNRWQV